MKGRRHGEPLPLGGADGLPYSKGLMARALIATGLAAERAYELARRVEADYAERGQAAITLDRVRELAVELYGSADGAVAVDRLRRYGELQELDQPLILLVGGATGTGKSTVATEAAYRLGITRVTSTDFVRHTMRAFFSRRFMPSVHYSSFEAGKAFLSDDDPADQVVPGYLDQTRNVLVGVEAALERSLEEGFSMVLEGVHLLPGLVRPEMIRGALVVQCVLAIEDPEAHASRFLTRDAASSGLRPVERYRRGFDDIRRVQDFIVARARRAGIPVIENEDVDHGISTVMELVLAAVAETEETAVKR